MQINKGNILKSIESFIGADNELAIKEAEHQIKVFEVVFQKEVESFQERGNEDEKNINPVHIFQAFLKSLAYLLHATIYQNGGMVGPNGMYARTFTRQKKKL